MKEDELYELIEECKQMLENISDNINICEIPVDDFDWLKNELVKIRDSIPQY